MYLLVSGRVKFWGPAAGEKEPCRYLSLWAFQSDHKVHAGLMKDTGGMGWGGFLMKPGLECDTDANIYVYIYVY